MDGYNNITVYSDKKRRILLKKGRYIDPQIAQRIVLSPGLLSFYTKTSLCPRICCRPCSTIKILLAVRLGAGSSLRQIEYVHL